MSWTSPPVIATGALVTAAMWNANFSYLYDSGWITLVAASSGYTNSWVSNNGPATGGTAAGLRQIGNVVRLGGNIKGGATATVALTLLAAYRPKYDSYLPANVALTTSAVVQLEVIVTGVCTVYFTSGSYSSLEGMTYTVD